MTWDEFGKVINVLIGKIQERDIVFDAVSPILRNGAIPGTIIANRLEIITCLPVQVKYNYKLKHPEQLLPFYKPLKNQLPDKPKILVTECNTFSGNSAIKAAEIIKEEFPACELYYATVTRVYRKQTEPLSMYKEYFYGQLTNENFEADQETEVSLNLRRNITVFPWESVEKELQDINSYFEE